MKSFEDVYKKLEYLFLIEKLPESIKKVNKEHNDGIFVNQFTNKDLRENCIKLAYFKCSVENVECTEKDRIIENTIIDVIIELFIADTKHDYIIFSRYIEAFNRILREKEDDEILEIKILRINTSSIKIRIILE